MFSSKRDIKRTNMSSYSRPDRHRTPAFTRAMRLRTSKLDLERDSGFSDASSEYLSTVDVTESEGAGGTRSVFSQDPTGSQLAVMRGSFAGLSPMIIMNHFVPNQPLMAPAEKQWGFPSPLELMPQSQVVLLQPMVSNGSSNSPKTCAENAGQLKGHMPTPKSYPRIAPQPADLPSKRVGSSRMRGCSSSGHDQQQRKHHHSHRPYSSPGPQPPLQAPVNATPTSDAGHDHTQTDDNQEQLSEKSLYLLVDTSALLSCTDEFKPEVGSERNHADECQQDLSIDSNKQKRFSNTYNILNKSGLLGITLRTKQLMKENRRTQCQLQQLREQTALLLEALSSKDPQLWTKLQHSLQSTDKEHLGTKAQIILA
ncbi:CLOCK-interacting pacemaker a isoform X2 [Solea solea]|uniref:CLOCK-interacting pacemaker a isoform X2 n=1 Tax=Solea solea TaxID=90069 RepID=UPI002729530A|nr:CLOCK-interacting pacemaker a isoform X2 [Solea solea]